MRAGERRRLPRAGELRSGGGLQRAGELRAEDDVATEFESAAESDAESEIESEDDIVSSNFSSVELDEAEESATESALESESSFESLAADLSERESYDPAEDSFDYALDAEDDHVSEVDFEEDAENEEESVVDEVSLETLEAFAEKMSSALDHVQRLGRARCEPLVHAICHIHSRLTAEEPTLSELLSIFSDILQSFAEEALEVSSKEESESAEVSYAESTDVAV